MAFAGVSVVSDGAAVGHDINVTTASGYHLLVVNGYNRSKDTAPSRTAFPSVPFMVGGHHWCIRYYPNGTINSDSADHISLFLHLVDEKVADILKVRYTFSFVDELEKQDSAYILAKVLPTNFSSSVPSWGYLNFMIREALEKSEHLKDDCFTIRCDINIVTTIDHFIAVPPSSIQQNIGDLLKFKEGTDVTFKVGDETFVAHRCVLAARSAVFKAELFGPMREGTITTVVHVEEMEAKVFQALLSFIYTNSLPEIETNMVEEEGESQEALWLQHLLAAADRYDLQRLKVLCEEKLCGHIDMSLVTTILTLAEQHHCRGLKEVCFEFLKTPANLKAITAVDGLEDITRTCPPLLKELITKLAS